MKKIFILVAALWLVHFGFAQAAGDKLDTLLSAYAKMYRFNGAALVAKKGNILLSKGYGYRDAMGMSFNTAQTIYQLGSITKQFTSAVILKLQEEKN